MLSNNEDDPGPARIFIDAMKDAKYLLQVYEYTDLSRLQLDLQIRFKNLNVFQPPAAPLP
jgi:hypothetical protein